MSKEKKGRLSVSLGQSLYGWLCDRAKFNRRSLSGEIEFILKEERERVTGMVFAPFTSQQVDALNEHQANGRFHEYTCNAGDRSRCPDGNGTLIATKDGWVCPCGKYTQDWARQHSGRLSD